MEKSISEQMDDMRQKTKDAYVRGIGTPESKVEQRADNINRAEICADIIESNNICFYCTAHKSCNGSPTIMSTRFVCFVGRKLRPC